MRIKLAENPNFDIDFIFRDQQVFDVINAKDIMEFLNIYRIAITPREAEYIINLNSKTPNIMDFESLYNTILPKTDRTLYQTVLNKRKKTTAKTFNMHFASEVTQRSVSELEVARLFEQELIFYRALESAKKDFRENHDITLRDLFKLIDFRSKGYLDFESLHNFMTRLKVLFTEDEYWALLRRIAVNLDNKIEYQEMVYAVFPNEPYNYPVFREKFQAEDAVEKARQFGFVEENELKEFDKRIRPLTFIGSGLRNRSTLNFLKDNLSQERKNFIYDQNYHLHYHNYKARFLEPSKDISYQLRKPGLGIRGVDDFFGDYYSYLNDRQAGEEFFNKYGKRYEYENRLESFRGKVSEEKEKTLVETFRVKLSDFKPTK